MCIFWPKINFVVLPWKLYNPHFHNLEYEEDTKYSMEQKRKIAKQLEEDEEIEPVVENTDLIKKEMEALFGTEKADEILAMETAMQLNFEKARDSYKAQLWPCLPLNMKFK